MHDARVEDVKLARMMCRSEALFVFCNRSAVGHFGGLARRNHLVFVEALFQHPTPQAFCQTLHDVYFDAVPPAQVNAVTKPIFFSANFFLCAPLIVLERSSRIDSARR